MKKHQTYIGTSVEILDPTTAPDGEVTTTVLFNIPGTPGSTVAREVTNLDTPLDGMCLAHGGTAVVHGDHSLSVIHVEGSTQTYEFTRKITGVVTDGAGTWMCTLEADNGFIGLVDVSPIVPGTVKLVFPSTQEIREQLLSTGVNAGATLVIQALYNRAVKAGELEPGVSRRSHNRSDLTAIGLPHTGPDCEGVEEVRYIGPSVSLSHGTLIYKHCDYTSDPEEIPFYRVPCDIGVGKSRVVLVNGNHFDVRLRSDGFEPGVNSRIYTEVTPYSVLPTPQLIAISENDQFWFYEVEEFGVVNLVLLDTDTSRTKPVLRTRIKDTWIDENENICFSYVGYMAADTGESFAITFDSDTGVEVPNTTGTMYKLTGLEDTTLEHLQDNLPGASMLGTVDDVTGVQALANVTPDGKLNMYWSEGESGNNRVERALDLFPELEEMPESFDITLYGNAVCVYGLEDKSKIHCFRLSTTEPMVSKVIEVSVAVAFPETVFWDGEDPFVCYKQPGGYPDSTSLGVMMTNEHGIRGLFQLPPAVQTKPLTDLHTLKKCNPANGFTWDMGLPAKTERTQLVMAIGTAPLTYTKVEANIGFIHCQRKINDGIVLEYVCDAPLPIEELYVGTSCVIYRSVRRWDLFGFTPVDGRNNAIVSVAGDDVIYPIHKREWEGVCCDVTGKIMLLVKREEEQTTFLTVNFFPVTLIEKLVVMGKATVGTPRLEYGEASVTRVVDVTSEYGQSLTISVTAIASKTNAPSTTEETTGYSDDEETEYLALDVECPGLAGVSECNERVLNSPHIPSADVRTVDNLSTCATETVDSTRTDSGTGYTASGDSGCNAG